MLTPILMAKGERAQEQTMKGDVADVGTVVRVGQRGTFGLGLRQRDSLSRRHHSSAAAPPSFASPCRVVSASLAAPRLSASGPVISHSRVHSAYFRRA